MKHSFRQWIINYRFWLLVLLGGLAICAAVMANLILENNKKEALYLKTERERLKSEISTILKTYEYFSNYIYHQMVLSPKVLQLMENAAEGSEALKKTSREALYSHLKDNYALMQKYSFRQLHFHLRNGESFLRFHTPKQYGDNLMNIREAIRIANTDKRYVFGFEEGRVFNGYRFVYPIFKDGRHLGSVEVSVSMATLFDVLYNLYPDIDLYFLIDKSVVEKIVFKKNLGNYLGSFIDEGYLYDKEIFEKFFKSNLAISPERLKSLRAIIKEQSRSKLKSKEDFSLIINFDRAYYLIQFIAVKNISGAFVGYCMTMKKNEAYPQIFRNLSRDLLLMAIIFVLFFVLTFIYAKNKLHLERLSSTDKLTSIYNRHYFLNQAKKELLRADRYGYPISLAMLDVDHFKSINDDYGHDTGDEVLKNLAFIVGSHIRQQDIFARWGGEEFLILMPETPLPGALSAAEKLRGYVEAAMLCKHRPVTVSIGVTKRSGSREAIDHLISRADAALYRAKHEGRNRVCADPGD